MDEHLDPIEHRARRKIPGMANTWEIWVDCEICNGEGERSIWINGSFQVDECSQCHGYQGFWEMEVDE